MECTQPDQTYICTITVNSRRSKGKTIQLQMIKIEIVETETFFSCLQSQFNQKKTKPHTAKSLDRKRVQNKQP